MLLRQTWNADPAWKALIETTNEWEFIEAAVVLSKRNRLILDSGWVLKPPTSPHPSPGERISGEIASAGAYRMARIQRVGDISSLSNRPVSVSCSSRSASGAFTGYQRLLVDVPYLILGTLSDQDILTSATSETPLAR